MLAERLLLGLQVSVVGLFVVFVALLLTAAIISLLRFSEVDARGRGGRPLPGEEKTLPPAHEPAREGCGFQAENGVLPPKVVAAIAGAVAVVMEGQRTNFRIRAVRRVPADTGSTAWVRAGRLELMAARTRMLERKETRR